MWVIANYDELYRPYDKSGRDLVNPHFVKLPQKINGRGLKALRKNAKSRWIEVFGVWALLLELATAQKPEFRGQLRNYKDEPASIQEIAEDIGAPKRIRLVEYTLNLLAVMGWVKMSPEGDTVSPKDGTSRPLSEVKLSEVKRSKGDVYNSVFEKFWSIYPRRWIRESDKYVKRGKYEAWQEWQRLTEKERALAKKYIGKVKTGEYVPDACRWLKRKLFDDFVPIAPLKSTRSEIKQEVESYTPATEEEKKQVRINLPQFKGVRTVMLTPEQQATEIRKQKEALGARQ